LSAGAERRFCLMNNIKTKSKSNRFEEEHLEMLIFWKYHKVRKGKINMFLLQLFLLKII